MTSRRREYRADLLRGAFVIVAALSICAQSVAAKPHEIIAPLTSHDYEFKEVKPDKTETIAVAADKKRHESVGSVQPPSTDDYADNAAASPLKVYAEYSVDSDLDFGRSAASESSTSKVSTMANTLKPINKQFLPANVSDMVLTDIRTPPKIKSQMQQSLFTSGKGEAIPVVLDSNEDGSALEKVSADNFKYTVHNDEISSAAAIAATPSSGLSTWILLNSDSISTPLSSSHQKKVSRPTLYDVSNLTSTENATTVVDGKKKVRPNLSVSSTPLSSSVGSIAASTTEKNIKFKIDPIAKKPERKPIATIQKVNQTYAKKPTTTVKSEPDEIITTTLSSLLQDLKFKNKTPVVMGKIPSTTKMEPPPNVTTTTPFTETVADNGTRLGTPVVTFPHVPPRHRPGFLTSKKPPMTITAKPSLSSSSSLSNKLVEPTTSAPSSTDTAAIITVEEIAPIATETTTKKIAASSTSVVKKKKKKNKNKKRRRPSSKKPAKVQSKISDDENTTLAKIPGTLPNRPLSTRIYNYLAREVMPNVGVGLVGLVLTAGLAGLLLYPFGGAVPVRRNYDKNHPPYNINDYPPVNEVDNAQPEESVLSQVLAGMSNSMNQYSREQPDAMYKNLPKYKPARFDNAGSGGSGGGGAAFSALKDSNKYTTERETVNEPIKYSELGDVVSGPHESVKFTSFDINDSIKYPPQPSPNYSTIDLTTNGQGEPVAFHTKNQTPLDGSNVGGGGTVVKTQHEPVYSTLGEYASYSSFNEPVQNPVYKGESSSYDYKNHKNGDQDMQEFKVSSEMEVVTQPPPQPSVLPDHSNASTVKSTKAEQPSFAALEGIPKNYRTLQTSIRFEDAAAAPVLPMSQDFVPSDGVFAASVEHGPRNMKLRRRRRRRRNTSNENELDSVLDVGVEKSPSPATNASSIATPTPTQFVELNANSTNTSSEQTIVTALPVVKSESLNRTGFDDVKASSTEFFMSNEILTDDNDALVANSSSTDNTTATTTGAFKIPEKNRNGTAPVQGGCDNCDDLSNIEDSPTSTPANNVNTQPAASITSIFRRILDFKLRLGMELIRATSEAITSYLGSVQQRMSEALRTIQRGAFRSAADGKNTIKKQIKKREKRHIVFGNVI